MLQQLETVPRLLVEAGLTPHQGDRFQPTGFADLGAAVYERGDGTRMLLVESAQSVANRLEKTILEGDGPHLDPELSGLPYLVAKLLNKKTRYQAVTSSLVEAHRLNSPFLISDPEFQAKFKELSGYAKGQLLDWRRLAAAIFRFDPNSLIHGVFLANLEDGRVRFPRAVSGFIEASGIREAASGGVKNNRLDPTGSVRSVGFDRDVYGNVPYHRVEFTAERIRAYFNLDLALLRSYGLGPEAEGLLVALTLLKIRRFLRHGLRLRTACDLKPGELEVTEPDGFRIPEEGDLLAFVKARIHDCKGAFAAPPITEISVAVTEKKGREGSAPSADEGE